MRNKKRYLKTALLLLSLVVILIFLVWVDLGDIIDNLRRINPYLFLAACFFIIVGILLRSIRFMFFTSVKNIKISFIDNFLIHSVAGFFGLITPLRLGEGSKIIYFKEKKKEIGVYFFIEKFFDFTTLLIFGFIGIVLFRNFINMYLLILVIFILAIILFFYSPKIINFIFKKEIIDIQWIKSTVRELKTKRLVMIMLISIIVWLNTMLVAYFLALSVGIDISYFFLLQVTSVSILAGFLSGLPNGLGTQEVSLTFLLISYFGVAKDIAGMFALLLRIIFFVVLIPLSLIAQLILNSKKK